MISNEQLELLTYQIKSELDKELHKNNTKVKIKLTDVCDILINLDIVAANSSTTNEFFTEYVYNQIMEQTETTKLKIELRCNNRSFYFIKEKVKEKDDG